MQPNWFFAFPVAGAFLEALPKPPAGLRRFPPEDVHLTVAFLGGCGEQAAMDALAVLDARLQAAPQSAIDVSLGSVVPMGGSRRRYTALSALLENGREAAIGCIDALRDPLLAAACGRKDARPIKPHVTLARPNRRASAEQRTAGIAWADSLGLTGVRLRLDRIALYTWSGERPKRLFRTVAERRCLDLETA